MYDKSRWDFGATLDVNCHSKVETCHFFWIKVLKCKVTAVHFPCLFVKLVTNKKPSPIAV